ncbi:hypothetical protein [Motiliproteus sp. MSK22-1]|uniref:hypothetical protein n=1 Tax=Motiliproteus sp. MSK22-1 TaxID=1897630 RepID=UPI0009757E4E|nr:hypothetical protein [Motiliproteus sp. MSK22-1]OMH32809.1 hypothetical protein BGP75_14905 [Motiliproteus sp. MSK22-1]
MNDDQKPLADIWLELQLITMATDLSVEDRERLEKTLESLKGHVSHNQENQRKVILRWFTARLGSRLFTSHYKQLLLELANLMATIWTGTPQFKSSDEVLNWLQEEPVDATQQDKSDDDIPKQA